MITYKDMTFCIRSGPKWVDSEKLLCGNTECFRYFTEDDRHKAAAVKLPVAWSDLKTAGCGFVERKSDGR